MRFPDEIRLAPDEFRLLRDLINQHCGISLSPEQRPVIERRLRERLSVHGLHSFGEYYQLLRSPDRGRAELDEALDLVTINETYFYREDYQLRCLTSSLLDRITARKRPGQSIRLWSIPCSTGEEPYSIAIWLLENWPQVDAWEIEIIGSDIDSRVLEAAEAGVYSERSLMRLPRPLVERYFTAIGNGRYRIDAELRGSVRFSQVNLIDQDDTARWRNIDVVFCRNVLIYFDEVSRRTAANNLYDSMAPGGFICLGHTESMSRISPLFQVCRFDDAIVYQKPGEGGHG